MKLADFLLHPVMLFLIAGGGVAVGSVTFAEYYWSNKRGTDGIVFGLFLFASTSLLAAVLRRGQMRGDD